MIKNVLAEQNKQHAPEVAVKVEWDTEDGSVLMLTGETDDDDFAQVVELMFTSEARVKAFFAMVDEARDAFLRHVADGKPVGLL